MLLSEENVKQVSHSTKLKYFDVLQRVYVMAKNQRFVRFVRFATVIIVPSRSKTTIESNELSYVAKKMEDLQPKFLMIADCSYLVFVNFRGIFVKA